MNRMRISRTSRPVCFAMPVHTPATTPLARSRRSVLMSRWWAVATRTILSTAAGESGREQRAPGDEGGDRCERRELQVDVAAGIEQQEHTEERNQATRDEDDVIESLSHLRTPPES